ncbi:MAG: NeuD/PglB/VioB family sugar acetyltransferase [Pirellulaceae bacterium]
MKANQVILVGGFCEMFELCLRCGLDIVGVIDSSPRVVSGYDIPYLGTDEAVIADSTRLCRVPLVIVPDSPTVRRRLVKRYRLAGFGFASVISPEADLSPTSELQEGVVVQSHVVVTAQNRIGAFAKLNIGAKVFHECQVGDFVTVAPGATLLGRVKVGKETYIGASSTILPERVIGRGCMVGAGAVVTHDVPDRHVVAGVPARRLGQV